jgi:hypothetical protein
MAKFCLTLQTKNEFKKGLKEGTINPDALSKMTSEARREFLKKYVGENAKQVNALFESKLLLKNQKAGYISWAKKVSGISPEIKRDLISKIEKLDRVLNPAENEAFLEDLAATRLGVNITQKEAKKISEMSARIAELERKTDKTKSDVALGRAKLDLTDYVNQLGGKKAGLITNIAGVPRAIMSSLDFSAPLNQGWGMLSRKQFYTSFAKMFKYAASKNAFRDLQAEIITHPNYETAKKAGLRLTDLGDKLEMREEQFMTSLLDKVPGVSASQRAYTGFLNKLRMDVFSDLIKKAEVAGENVSAGSQAAEDIANVVNNFTGGARVGKTEKNVPLLNAVFFSPRKITSTLQIMNPLNYVNPKISKTARLAATRNLIGSLAISASIIALYSLLTGKKPETDPTSSDFGKIRAGDARLDVAGGNATYAILLSRILQGRIKGSSGISKPLGTSFGQTSATDLMKQFIRYKLSPNASLLVDVLAKENAIGEKKTPAESVVDRFKPMFAESVVELLKSDSDNKLAFALAGLFGAGLNTYSADAKWEEKETKEMKQFKEKVGEIKFKEANDRFNTEYNAWFEKTKESQNYKSLSEENKQSLLNRAKNALQKKIFMKYRFKYKPEKENKNIKRMLPK